jgi:WD40 repeat protein
MLPQAKAGEIAMTLAPAARPNPYIGPRSFQTGEMLYGRDRETQDLLGLLIAERVVLLHSPSGAGKTSLVQAALIPRLIEREFTVLPVMRVSIEPPHTTTDHQPPTTDDRDADESSVVGSRSSAVGNRYVLSALLALEEGVPGDQQMPLAALAALSLNDYLDQRAAAVEGGADVVLIFDQFEEILTLDPTDQAAKAAFFVQVGAALRNRRRWALFSMREDYVASLAPYLRPVPTRLATTYRLDLLAAADARQAIQAPAHRLGVDFDDAAAARLVDDLCRVYAQLPDGTLAEQLGPTVEPVQLQVVCYRMWDQLPADARAIGAADVGAVGDVDTALADYYSERVTASAAASGVGERAIREWFDRQLISPQGIRGQVLQGADQSQGLPNRAIRPLIDAYLVRAEKRRGATWFELAHDRLIEPLRENNAAWFAANLSTLQRQADLWERQSRPAGLLLRDQELAEAEQWAAANANALTAAEREFLQLSREERARAARERRNNRLIRGLFVAALVVAAVAIFFFYQAQIQATLAQNEATHAQNEADRADKESVRAKAEADNARNQQATSEAQKSRADTEATNARRQQQIAQERALETAVVNKLTVDPELSVLLATQVISASAVIGAPVLSGTLDTLQQAVQASRIQHTLRGHAKGIQGVAYAPDGKTLATASNDGTVKLWDMATGRELLTIQGVADAVLGVTVSLDGRMLATAGADGKAKIWDVAAGKLITSIDAEDGAVNGVAFSPDGKLLATADDDGTAKLWDVASGRKLRAFEGHNDIVNDIFNPVNSVAFSPDGKTLATAHFDKTAKLWDVASGRELRTFEGHAESVEDVAFSPDGKTLATASVDETARLWNVATGQLLLRLVGHASNVSAVAFSADGAFLVTASADGTARIWNPRSGKELLRLAGHSYSLTSVAFSPDRSQVATGSLDKTTRIWSLAFLTPERPSFVAFAPAGDQLASASLDGAHIWDVASGRELRVLIGPPDGVSAVAYSRDGKLLATAGYDGTAKLWDAASGQELRAIKGHDQAIGRIAFSPDGTLLATASDDMTAKLWDTRSGQELRTLEGHTDQVFDIVFSRDGTLLATASVDGTARIWDAATGKELRKLEGTADLNSVAFSPDGARIATAAEDGTATIWDGATGHPLLSVHHAVAVNAVAFSPDGAWLATASWDKTVKIWDAASGRQLYTFTHPAEVFAATFSADGTRLATAAADGVVHVFPLKLDALLALAKQHVTRTLTAEECQAYRVAGPCAP